MKTKLKVFGYGSLEVEGKTPEEVFKSVDLFLGIEKAWEVKRVRRGAPKKVKPLIPEGAAVPQ